MDVPGSVCGISQPFLGVGAAMYRRILFRSSVGRRSRGEEPAAFGALPLKLETQSMNETEDILRRRWRNVTVVTQRDKALTQTNNK